MIGWHYLRFSCRYIRFYSYTSLKMRLRANFLLTIKHAMLIHCSKNDSTFCNWYTWKLYCWWWQGRYIWSWIVRTHNTKCISFMTEAIQLRWRYRSVQRKMVWITSIECLTIFYWSADNIWMGKRIRLRRIGSYWRTSWWCWIFHAKSYTIVAKTVQLGRCNIAV